jgi:hypothetical protein
MHHQRDFRARHPLRALFRAHLDHSKSRGIRVLWTFEDFILFCEATDYPNLLKEGWTIERDDPLLGYSLGNCSILTRSDNGFKGATYDYAVHKKAMGENPF